MGIKEFSDNFDALLDSYAHQADFGDTSSKIDTDLGEWEKSLFLTEYQEEFVLSLYNGRNTSGEGFEETEELRRYLADLVDEATPAPINNSQGMPLSANEKKAYFTLPEDLWFITYESLTVSKEACGNMVLSVVPVRQDEFNRIRKNPFRGANDHRALRLDLANGVVELISKFPIGEYYIRYMKKLKPIVLEELPEGLKIGDYTGPQECELPSYLHQRILEGAVRKALEAKRKTAVERTAS